MVGGVGANSGSQASWQFATNIPKISPSSIQNPPIDKYVPPETVKTGPAILPNGFKPSDVQQVNPNTTILQTKMGELIKGNVGINVQAFIRDKISNFNGGDRSKWKEWGDDFLKAFCADAGIDFNMLLPQEKEEILAKLQSGINATWQDSIFGPDTLKNLVDHVNKKTNSSFSENLKTRITDFDFRWKQIEDYYKEITDFNYINPAGSVPLMLSKDFNTSTGDKLAAYGKYIADRMGGTRSLGLCKTGVRRAFEAAGLGTIGGLSAYMAASQLARRPDFTEVQVSKDQLLQLPPGAVIVWNKLGEHVHGHIEISQGGGYASSDYTGRININNQASYRVFLPKS